MDRRKLLYAFIGFALISILALSSLRSSNVLIHSNDLRLNSFQGLSMPGVIEGSGTCFEIRDSSYLDVTLRSSKRIEVILTSFPKMVNLHVEPGVDSSTNLILEGLEPNKTYYKYQDTYQDATVIVSDQEGRCRWNQHLAQRHHIWIQEAHGTIFLPSQCSSCGTWDATTSTCTLNRDVYESIEINSSGMTLDCNNHSITGSETGFGIYLRSVNNVTIENGSVRNFSQGICVRTSSFVILENMLVSENSDTGITLLRGSGHELLGNRVQANPYRGVYLGFASSTWSNNAISGSQYNLWVRVEGCSVSDLTHSIDPSNTVDGKPIYYLVNEEHKETGEDAGYVGLVNCRDITVRGATLSGNYQGALLAYTQDSRIEGVRASGNVLGIQLWGSSNNQIVGNNITHNNEVGIMLRDSPGNVFTDNDVTHNVLHGLYLFSAPGNTFYHNNFDNPSQVYSSNPGNDSSFDSGYPSGGNYWSGHDLTDTKSGPSQDQDGPDGICDTAYRITYQYLTGEDRYPFVRENGWRLPWVEVKEDGVCMHDDQNGTPNLTRPFKCVPSGWILKRVVEDYRFVEITFNDALWWRVLDDTDGITGWITSTSLSWDQSKQTEWEERTELLSRDDRVAEIATAVEHYYENTDSSPSLYSSNDGQNNLALFRQIGLPVELILAIIAQESCMQGFDFNNELMTYDYGHGVMQVDLKPLSSDIKYLQIVLNSDPYTQVAPSGDGSPGNETHYFGWGTHDAVVRFQQTHEISPAKGIVGPLTRPKLNEVLEGDREAFTEKAIPREFRFEEYLARGMWDVFEGGPRGKPYDTRGYGSGLRIPPCGDFKDISQQNFYRNCYEYSGVNHYKQYAPHGHYGNTTFKYYTNTSQGIHANVKDGLRVLQDMLYISRRNYEATCCSGDTCNDSKELYCCLDGGCYDYVEGECEDPAAVILTCQDIHHLSIVQRYNSGVASYLKFSDYIGEDTEQGKGIAYHLKRLHLEDHFGAGWANPYNEEMASKAKYAADNNERVEVMSPADLAVCDSQGRSTGLLNGEIKEEIPSSMYDQLHKTVTILFPFDSYFYRLVGTEAGEYSLVIEHIIGGDAAAFDATNIPTSPDSVHQYALDWEALERGENGVALHMDADGDGTFEKLVVADSDLTYDEFILQTETVVNLDPDTLSLKSTGKRVTAYIELPEGYDVADIDVSTVLLEDTIPAELQPIAVGDHDGDGIADLMVKFDREALIAQLQGAMGQVTLTVRGALMNGMLFGATDAVLVIDRGTE